MFLVLVLEERCCNMSWLDDDVSFVMRRKQSSTFIDIELKFDKAFE